jgi:ribosomal protein S21
VHVTLREGETQEGLLSRFTKMIQRSGLLKEVKQKRHFISEGEKLRVARRRAIRRARKAAAKQASRL